MKKTLSFILALITISTLFPINSIIALANTPSNPSRIYEGTTTCYNDKRVEKLYDEMANYKGEGTFYDTHYYYFEAEEDGCYYVSDYNDKCIDGQSLYHFLSKGERINISYNYSDALDYYDCYNGIVDGIPSYSVTIRKLSEPFEYSYYNFTYLINPSNSTAELKNYMGSASECEIPSVFRFYAITSIGDYAFGNKTSLTSVKLPSTISKIGDYAFINCIRLKSVSVENNNCTFGKSIFLGCTDEAKVYNSYGDIIYPSTTSTQIQNPSYCNHNYQKSIEKATLSKDGLITSICSICGDEEYQTIAKINNVKLSSTSYKYDGKVKTPTVSVIDNDGKSIPTSNYSVILPSGRKNVGKYTITIKFKGNYSGSISKTFKINPKTTSISSLTAASKGFTVKWKKQATQTTGYQIQIATDSGFTKGVKNYTVSKNSTVSKKITKLTGKKKYYVRIRTYKTVSGTKYYSSWSGSKTVTTKK